MGNGGDGIENIKENILKAATIATTGLQRDKGKEDEITINITNITEDARERITEEVIKALDGLK